MNSIKKGLRWGAIVVAIGGLGFWLVAGAHRGWSRTSIPVKTLDEVTGIEGITYQRGFVPGVDFLAAVIAVAGLLALSSGVIRKRKE